MFGLPMCWMPFVWWRIIRLNIPFRNMQLYFPPKGRKPPSFSCGLSVLIPIRSTLVWKVFRQLPLAAIITVAAVAAALVVAAVVAAVVVAVVVADSSKAAPSSGWSMLFLALVVFVTKVAKV